MREGGRGWGPMGAGLPPGPQSPVPTPEKPREACVQWCLRCAVFLCLGVRGAAFTPQ